jgi:hypothetical protein
MPTFAFPKAPPHIAVRIRRRWNAPLPLPRSLGEILRFGTTLDARLLSTPCRSTSELLRTL